jgi:hypothetical protein
MSFVWSKISRHRDLRSNHCSHAQYLCLPFALVAHAFPPPSCAETCLWSLSNRFLDGGVGAGLRCSRLGMHPHPPPPSKRTHAPVTHSPISTTESPRPPMPPHSAHWLWMNAQSISETVCLQLVDGSLPCIEGVGQRRSETMVSASLW